MGDKSRRHKLIRRALRKSAPHAISPVDFHNDTWSGGFIRNRNRYQFYYNVGKYTHMVEETADEYSREVS